MARRSPWEHLKEEIFTEFAAGKKPFEVLQGRPDVPKSTVYDWYKEFRNMGKIIPESSETVAIEVLSPQKLVPIDGAEKISDFQLARKTLRAIAKNFNQPGAGVGVQAAMGLMKLVQLRAELPRHVIEELEVTSVDDERETVKDKTPAELAREYKALIDEAG